MPLAPHPCRRIDAPRWLVRDRFDNAAKLRRVRAPVFLMHGDADTLVTPDNLDRLARARPAATVARVAGAGHELAYTAPAQAILIRWVAGLRCRSPSAGGLRAAPPGSEGGRGGREEVST